MAVNEAWGRRLRDAKRDFEKRHDTSLSYTEIGRRVAKVLERRTPFAPTSARSWFVEGQEPETFAIAGAIAVVLEADAGYLMTGYEKPASVGGEEDIEIGAVALTPAQKGRARESAKATRESRRAAAAKKSARQAAANGPRGRRRKPRASE